MATDSAANQRLLRVRGRLGGLWTTPNTPSGQFDAVKRSRRQWKVRRDN